MKRRFACVVVVCGLAGLSLHAGSVMTAKPEEVGLSSERLARIHDTVQRHIDAGSLSGAVTLVARHGKIAHLEAHGLMDSRASVRCRRTVCSGSRRCRNQ